MMQAFTHNWIRTSESFDIGANKTDSLDLLDICVGGGPCPHFIAGN